MGTRRGLRIAAAVAVVGALVAAAVVYRAVSSSPQPLEGGPLVALSRTAAGEQPLGDSLSPAISADGRWVAFASDAPDLVEDDGDLATDAFLADRESGEVVRVGRSVQVSAPCGAAPEIAISGDGSTVVFAALPLADEGEDEPSDGESEDEDAQPVAQVYAWDRETGETRLVSTTPSGEPGAGSSCAPAVDADGSMIAFASAADDLVEGDDNEVLDVFVRDAAAESAERVSLDADGAELPGESTDPTLDGDGTTVAFESSGFGGDEVFEVAVLDLGGDGVRVITADGGADSYDAVLSADGAVLAFTSDADLVESDGDSSPDVYAVRLADGGPVLLSGGGEGDAYEPALDATGATVAFTTDIDGLAEGDSAGRERDVVVRGLDAEAAPATQARLVSARPDGVGGNSDSDQPALTADGRTIAFTSSATDLVDRDDALADVYARAVPPA